MPPFRPRATLVTMKAMVNENEKSGADVLALVDDLFFQAKLAETARRVGIKLKTVSTGAALMDALNGALNQAPGGASDGAARGDLPRLIVVDLNARQGPLEAIEQVAGRGQPRARHRLSLSCADGSGRAGTSRGVQAGAAEVELHGRIFRRSCFRQNREIRCTRRKGLRRISFAISQRVGAAAFCWRCFSARRADHGGATRRRLGGDYSRSRRSPRRNVDGGLPAGPSGLREPSDKRQRRGVSRSPGRAARGFAEAIRASGRSREASAFHAQWTHGGALRSQRRGLRDALRRKPGARESGVHRRDRSGGRRPAIGEVRPRAGSRPMEAIVGGPAAAGYSGAGARSGRNPMCTSTSRKQSSHCARLRRR